MFSIFLACSDFVVKTAEEDDLMASIDAYDCEEVVNRDLEKYLTNLNVHMAGLREQHMELTRSHDEFCANFMKQHELVSEQFHSEQHVGLQRRHEEFSANFKKQQEVLYEEFVKMRQEMVKLRRSMGK